MLMLVGVAAAVTSEMTGTGAAAVMSAETIAVFKSSSSVLLHPVIKICSKTRRNNNLFLLLIKNYILTQELDEQKLWKKVYLVKKYQICLCF